MTIVTNVVCTDYLCTTFASYCSICIWVIVVTKVVQEKALNSVF